MNPSSQVHWRDWVKMEFAPWRVLQHLSQWHSCEWASSENPFFQLYFSMILNSPMNTGKFSLYSQLPNTATNRDALSKQWGESGKVLTAMSPMSLSLSEEKLFFRKWKSTRHLHSEPHTPQCHLLLHFSHTHPHRHWKLTRIRVPLPSHPKVSWAGMQIHTVMIIPADAGTPEWLRLGHWSQSFPAMNKPQYKFSKPRSNPMFVSKLLNRDIYYHKSKFKLQQTI